MVAQCFGLRPWTDIDKARNAMDQIFTDTEAYAIEALIDAKIDAAFEKWEADALHESMHGEIAAAPREALNAMHPIVRESLLLDLTAEANRGDLQDATRNVIRSAVQDILSANAHIAELEKERDEARDNLTIALRDGDYLRAGAEKALAALTQDSDADLGARVRGAASYLTEALGATTEKGGDPDTRGQHTSTSANTNQPAPGDVPGPATGMISVSGMHSVVIGNDKPVTTLAMALSKLPPFIAAAARKAGLTEEE